MNCKKCGNPVSSDEIGLNKKLINRGITEYLCGDCLAAHFKLTRDDLQKMADHFREMGCVLFTRDL